jgi:cytochrome P450
LSFNSISALQEIYGSRNTNTKKGGELYPTIQAGLGESNTHAEMDRTRHASLRRILDHAFSDKALRSAEPLIQKNVKIWNKQLGAGDLSKDGWTTPKNLSVWNSFLGYDIMGELTFSKKFACLESEEHRYVPGILVEGNGMVYALSYSPLIYFLRPILATQILLHISGELGKKTLQFLHYTRAQMQERLLPPKSDSLDTRVDFVHYLLKAKDPETGLGFTKKQLNASSGLLISAGSDTTSTALTATIFYLLHNSDTLKKAEAEVRARFSSIDDVKGLGMTSELPYLTACIDEALRLAPPVPSQMYREVLADGITVDGQQIPVGTVVGVSPYVIHHNPEYYPEPFVFRPERWIVDEKAGVSEENVATARSAWCPFSLGTRGCIGKRLAYIELICSLGTLLYAYDLRLPVREQQIGRGNPANKTWGRARESEYQLVDKFLADRDGPMVEFKARF